MVTKRQCAFCAGEIEPGRGVMFVKRDGTVYHFCSGTCRKHQLSYHRVGHQWKWTRAHALKKEQARGSHAAGALKPGAKAASPAAKPTSPAAAPKPATPATPATPAAPGASGTKPAPKPAPAATKPGTSPKPAGTPGGASAPPKAPAPKPAPAAVKPATPAKKPAASPDAKKDDAAKA